MPSDPTYLRTIHDCLLSGIIHKDNASALPMGLVGMYEEALPPASNVNERKKFLEFFSVWALLRKEVSVAFLIPLLEGWSEETIIYYINKYSKWFNSPQSGKYVLYHERLRAFILQKISKQQFNAYNETIIKVAHDALSRRSGDEWENYALEYLSNHMLIPAIEKGDGTVLKLLAYNTTHWNRQVEISKGFEWSKRMLNDMMLWASKYDDEEVIECALNKVDLHHQEQNDAPRIVELVAQNDIENALDRIDKFGGQDKEGLQRKFILYMLCLMELTLLDSKEKPFRKEAIGKLLKHFDDNIPANEYDLINWNDFFPSYLMFQMAIEWAEFGLDYLKVYKRTDYWEGDWISENGPYINLQFEVLLKCNRVLGVSDVKSFVHAVISTELSKQGKIKEAESAMLEALEYSDALYDEYNKHYTLKAISTELIKQGRIDEALEFSHHISDNNVKSGTLIEISIELAKQGKIKEALECARSIPHDWEKSFVLTDISSELTKQRKTKLAASFLQQALKFAQGITQDNYKSNALKNIASELIKQGKIDKALDCARGIPDEWYKTCVMTEISGKLNKQGKIKKAASAMQESFVYADRIIDKSLKNSALNIISTELTKQGQIDNALAYARGINDEEDKNRALADISLELAKQGKIKEALECARSIAYKSYRTGSLKDISSELNNQGRIEEASSVILEALECACLISPENLKSSYLVDISTELFRQGKIDNALECAHSIPKDWDKSRVIKKIFTKLVKQEKINEAALKMRDTLVSFFSSSNNKRKNSMMTNIASELARQGNINQALECAHGISDDWLKCSVLNNISTELFKQRKIEEAESAIQEALGCAKGISHDGYKSNAMMNIANELIKQGKIDKSLSCARGISDELDKSRALANISTELTRMNNIERSAMVFQEAFACANSIQMVVWRENALIKISIELATQGKIREALETAKSIGRDGYISLALKGISCELSKQGKCEEAEFILQEAVRFAREIIDKADKSQKLKDISSELVKQGKIEEAATVMQEALDCAHIISDERYMNKAFAEIAIEMVQQGNWPLAEETSMEINQIAKRNDCWKKFAETVYEQGEWQKALRQALNFHNPEVQKYYLKGLAEYLSVVDCNADFTLNARQKYNLDIESIETLLQKHALHELFFEKPSKEKIERLNRTLNIQWAIDIKN